MQLINIRIDGITPLLMHAFSDADQIAASSGTRSSAAAGDRGNPREQAEQNLYKSEQEGNPIIIPQPNIFSCIVEAGKFFKAGKSKITTQKTSLVPAAVFFDETEYVLSNQEWDVDTRAVRIPSTGGRIQRHRPKFDPWGFEFDVRLDLGEFSENLFRDIVDAAGNKIGLGDFRPACKGPFGRFRVTHWESSEEVLEAAA